MRPDQLERRLRDAWTPSVPLPAPSCSTSSCSPTSSAPERIAEFWSYPQSRTFAAAPDRLRGGPDAPGGARGMLREAASKNSDRVIRRTARPRRTASRSSRSIDLGRVRSPGDVRILGVAYGPRMTQGYPLPSSRTGSMNVSCAICGHSEAVHSNSGSGRCLRSVCNCNGLMVGAGPDVSEGRPLLARGRGSVAEPLLSKLVTSVRLMPPALLVTADGNDENQRTHPR